MGSARLIIVVAALISMAAQKDQARPDQHPLVLILSERDGATPGEQVFPFTSFARGTEKESRTRSEGLRNSFDQFSLVALSKQKQKPNRNDGIKLPIKKSGCPAPLRTRFEHLENCAGKPQAR